MEAAPPTASGLQYTVFHFDTSDHQIVCGWDAKDKTLRELAFTYNVENESYSVFNIKEIPDVADKVSRNDVAYIRLNADGDTGVKITFLKDNNSELGSFTKPVSDGFTTTINKHADAGAQQILAGAPKGMLASAQNKKVHGLLSRTAANMGRSVAGGFDAMKHKAIGVVKAGKGLLSRGKPIHDDESVPLFDGKKSNDTIRQGIKYHGGKDDPIERITYLIDKEKVAVLKTALSEAANVTGEIGDGTDVNVSPKRNRTVDELKKLIGAHADSTLTGGGRKKKSVAPQPSKGRVTRPKPNATKTIKASKAATSTTRPGSGGPGSRPASAATPGSRRSRTVPSRPPRQPRP